MVSAECHKGSFCVYTPIFCQKGYCPGCEIYTKMTSATTQAGRRYAVKLQKSPELIPDH